ncbi:hypothetical protein AVEN_76101-1 [Araneus ventricosus]|uniref:Uncharacterized protein n=1 Tax=Araneus ventricosus TaxID=182803 RepID=A0A4Y2HBR6_ARAVE|nr:hypothetical protein AVEN_76101-1 [Araneus ventricosus]
MRIISTSKSFMPGDQVYLLIPDSSNKLYARWTGPGEIIKHIPPHSYLVKLPDGRKKQIHVNKIRKFQMRVNMVGVIFQNEEKFGEITVPEKDYLLPSQKLEMDCEVDLDHLNELQKEKIKELLIKH